MRLPNPKLSRVKRLTIRCLSEEEPMTLRTLAIALLVSIVVVAGAFASTEKDFRNQTGGDVLGIRIQFSTYVAITDSDDVFPDVEPVGNSMGGKAREFTFTGGSLRSNATFSLSWDAPAMVMDWEWVTHDADDNDSPGYDCSTTINAEWFNLAQVLNRTWDGMVVCLEPGRYEIPGSGLIIIEDDVSLVGLGPDSGSVVICSSEYGRIQFVTQGDATLVLENLSFAGDVRFGFNQATRCIATRVNTALEPERVALYSSVRHDAVLEMYECVIGAVITARDSGRLILVDCHADPSLSTVISVSSSDANLEGTGNHMSWSQIELGDHDLPERFLADD